MNEKATNSDESRPAVGGPGCNEGLGPLPTIRPGETDAEFVAQIEATHCRPLTPPERMPQYIRDELPDELAAHRLQAWADARVAAERERCAKLVETMDTTGHDGYIETTADLCEAIAARIRRA